MANPNKWSKTTADNATADGDINWQEGQQAGTVNNSARAMMQGWANWLDDTGGALITGGSATAYTATTNSVNTAAEAHAEGFELMVEWHATNTGADPTIAVDGLTAKTIYKNDGTSLSASDLPIGERDTLVYDAGSNGYRVLGQRPSDLPTTATTTTEGLVERATVAEIREPSTDGKFGAIKDFYDRAELVLLTDGASISWDMGTGINFYVQLGGNRTLANPTNIATGMSGILRVQQDGTGGRTLSFGSNYLFAGGTAPTLTTTAFAYDMFSYYVMSGGENQIVLSVLLDVK